MKTGKHLAGVALFLVIFGSTVVINNFLRAPVGTVPPVEINSATPITILEAKRPSLNYSVRMVSLDFINGKSYATLLLKRDAGQPIPEKLWVRTLFFAPGRNDSERWSTLGEIGRPFSHGERVEITATGECAWCGDSNIPKAGYYAQVYVSTDYAETRLTHEQIDLDMMPTFPVVVQSERNSNPFATR